MLKRNTNKGYSPLQLHFSPYLVLNFNHHYSYIHLNQPPLISNLVLNVIYYSSIVSYENFVN